MRFAYFNDRKTLDENYEYEPLGSPVTLDGDFYKDIKWRAEHLPISGYDAVVEVESRTFNTGPYDHYLVTVQPVRILRYRGRTYGRNSA